MGCAGCAMHNGPQQSEGPLRVSLFNFKIIYEIYHVRRAAERPGNVGNRKWTESLIDTSKVVDIFAQEKARNQTFQLVKIFRYFFLDHRLETCLIC